MSEIQKFQDEKKKNINLIGKDEKLKKTGFDFIINTAKYKYSYNFSWMGRPIIQFPQDMVAMQELIWEVKPDLIIETGIAHGGSLIYYASLMKMMDIEGKVLGIDIDIREHNRKEIEKHPVASRIQMIQGSSIDESIIAQVKQVAKNYKKIMVVLDSNHTHDHVLQELRAYASLTSINSYCIVFDTVVEDMPEGSFPDRPWDKGDNPKTAVWQYLKENKDFMIDESIHNKLLITVAPDGYLKRIR